MVKLTDVKKITDTIWEVSKGYKTGMRVPARLFGSKKIIQEMDQTVLEQIANVATLPGITNYAYCMPDGHFGYGFPIGGMAAMDISQGGVISPGGIGFDINCGMRLLVTNLTLNDIKPHIKPLIQKLYSRIPAGVATKGFLEISKSTFRDVIEQGAHWCVKEGYGWKEDLELTEEEGRIEGADARKVSEKAIERGYQQIGTLGSGNHYLEIQYVKPEHLYDKETAKAYGITQPYQVVIMFHCGSRGFGHQVATDYLRVFLNVMQSKYGIEILDRELACAPFDSPEGQDYFAAMKCGINMSFANRQVILHRIREVFAEYFHKSPQDLGMRMVYDVAHNTAKLETHEVNGKKKKLLVHRKGATRAFGPGMEGIPERYKAFGQPVIIGGSMETGSYLMAGVPGGKETFFTTAHGSGRTMSRTKARHQWHGEALFHEMEKKGIYVLSTSWSGLAEEAGGAYKDIDEVIDASVDAGISKKIARFTPIGNIKG